MAKVEIDIEQLINPGIDKEIKYALIDAAFKEDVSKEELDETITVFGDMEIIAKECGKDKIAKTCRIAYLALNSMGARVYGEQEA